MTFRIGLFILLIFFVLTACGETNSVKEVLENDIFHLEILNETETKYGKVVFYKTELPNETYGARLLKKNGWKWEMLLGSEIHGVEESENVAWAWQSKTDEPAFVFGLIKNNEIRKLSVNGTDAVIINMERGYDLFYLLTNDNPLSIQNNGEKGTQIKGFSDEGEVVYQRLNFD